MNFVVPIYRSQKLVTLITSLAFLISQCVHSEEPPSDTRSNYKSSDKNIYLTIWLPKDVEADAAIPMEITILNGGAEPVLIAEEPQTPLASPEPVCKMSVTTDKGEECPATPPPGPTFANGYMRSTTAYNVIPPLESKTWTANIRGHFRLKPGHYLLNFQWDASRRPGQQKLQLSVSKIAFTIKERKL